MKHWIELPDCPPLLGYKLGILVDDINGEENNLMNAEIATSGIKHLWEVSRNSVPIEFTALHNVR